MKKIAISNDMIASAFTNRLLKAHGLISQEAPAVFNETVDLLKKIDMYVNMLPHEMRTNKDVLNMIKKTKREQLVGFAQQYGAPEVPVGVKAPFFKNWKLILPSSVGLAAVAGGAYYYNKKKEEDKKKLTKKAGGPGSGKKEDNTMPITDLEQSDVIRIGGRKAIIDTQPCDTKIIKVSDLKYAAQDNYVPKKLNGVMEAMSKPDWVDKPIDVMEVNGEYHVLDGHHRALAAIKLHRKEIPARIYKGCKKEAFLERLQKCAEEEVTMKRPPPRGLLHRANQSFGIARTMSENREISNDLTPNSWGLNLDAGMPQEDPATKVVY